MSLERRVERLERSGGDALEQAVERARARHAAALHALGDRPAPPEILTLLDGDTEQQATADARQLAAAGIEVGMRHEDALRLLAADATDR